jgi:hypothetical protein
MDMHCVAGCCTAANATGLNIAAVPFKAFTTAQLAYAVTMKMTAVNPSSDEQEITMADGSEAAQVLQEREGRAWHGLLPSSAFKSLMYSS